MEHFVHLSVNWCFSASIGSFQGLPAETSEVILLSQRLALKYNTTPRGSCQHFLTSFFQILCARGITPSVIACGDATHPLLSPTVTSSPGAGEVGPQGDGFSNGGKVSGIAQRRPLGGAGTQRLRGFVSILLHYIGSVKPRQV